MTWQGINRGITSVSEDMGASEYQQNTRMTVKGELQRRPGMAPANFSPQGTAALGMVGAFPTSGPYGMIVDTAGTVNGFPITMPIWGPPQLKPPLPQQVPLGGMWQMDVNGLTGVNAQFTAFGCLGGTFCNGVINITRLAGRVSGGSWSVWRSDGAAALPVASGSYGTEIATTSVAVPFSTAYPILYIGINDTFGPVAVYPTDSKSAVGCGNEWRINIPPTLWSVITQYTVTNSRDCSGGGKCPGKITLDFSSVTAAGSIATVWRTNGGPTLIVDSRAIVTGSRYTVNVPASNTTGIELPAIYVQINMNGGTVSGSIVGLATDGCG